MRREVSKGTVCIISLARGKVLLPGGERGLLLLLLLCLGCSEREADASEVTRFEERLCVQEEVVALCLVEAL